MNRLTYVLMWEMKSTKSYVNKRYTFLTTTLTQHVIVGCYLLFHTSTKSEKQNSTGKSKSKGSTGKKSDTNDSSNKKSDQGSQQKNSKSSGQKPPATTLFPPSPSPRTPKRHYLTGEAKSKFHYIKLNM